MRLSLGAVGATATIVLGTILSAALLLPADSAERTPPPAKPGVAPAPPSPAPAQAPAPAGAPTPAAARPVASPYDGMSRMVLEANYAGPLKDTLIQRLRDPVDGTTCYLYLPIAVPHGPPLEDGMVRYGANPVGSLSCFAAPASAQVAANAATPKR